MEPSAIATLVTSLLAAGVAAWAALRKQRATESADDDERWKAYAKERQKQHTADVQRLEKKIEQQAQRLDEMQAAESKCRIEMAELKAENRTLREEIAELKRDLAECGLRPGTGERKPLQG